MPLALWSLSLWLAAALAGVPVWPAVVMIVCVGTCMYAHLPAFWPIPTTFLGSAAAASAIGFINMIGNLGGSVGPTVVGKAATPPPLAHLIPTTLGLGATPAGAGAVSAAGLVTQTQISFTSGLLKMAPWTFAAAIAILTVGYVGRKRLAAVAAKETHAAV